MALAGQAPPAVIAVVALSSFLRRASQVFVKSPTRGLVVPGVSIDRFVADCERPISTEPPRNLLRAPLLSEQPFDESKVFDLEVTVSSRAGSPAAGVPVGQLRSVGAVARGAIATNLPKYRTSMPAQDPGDSGRREPSPSK